MGKVQKDQGTKKFQLKQSLRVESCAVVNNPLRSDRK
jgi:hypothetical protein